MKFPFIFLALVWNISIVFSQNLKAGLSCDPDSSGFDNYTVKCLIKFTDQSIGNPNSWAWDFGDGATSLIDNPSHEFGEFFRTFQIRHVVYDSLGHSDTAYYSYFNDTTCSCNNLTGVISLKENTQAPFFFPNPFHAHCVINIMPELGSQNIYLKLYSRTGNVVREQKTLNTGPNIFNRDNLTEGMYFYELRGGSNELIARGKILIN